MRALLLVPIVLALAGCSVNQGMAIKRTAHYDAKGQLTGYTVEEIVHLPEVKRPADREQADVMLFETGTTRERQPAKWPPPRLGSSLRTAENR